MLTILLCLSSQSTFILHVCHRLCKVKESHTKGLKLIVDAPIGSNNRNRGAAVTKLCGDNHQS